MIGRIVEVASDGVHLSVDRGFIKVTRQGEHLGQIALDDIASLVVHGHGATFSANLVSRLAERKASLIICASNHAPIAFLWPVEGHYSQGMRMQAQAEASRPLKKRLWRDIIKNKILTQASVLKIVGAEEGAFHKLARDVRSGDPDNLEAQAARRYWPLMMGADFKRDRSLPGINGFLNYGYMILRAATARSIIAAGLHPSLSIFHMSRGEALRLSDDLMEPFRPYVDLFVKRLWDKGQHDLNTETKREISSIATFDLKSTQGASPLQTCLDRLATSLAQVYLNEKEELEFPGPPFLLA